MSERYVAIKNIDCSGASGNLPLDYPARWLRP
jgi:hypothetical protein